MKIAICGAGIAGIATAYYIKEILPLAEIILVDKNQPLSFTSSVSGENFRDYWPHPCMQQLSSRSIDLMIALKRKYGKESFTMKLSGYHFVSRHINKPIFRDDNDAEFRKQNEVETDAQIIRQKHPHLHTNIQKSVFIKKAGYVDSMVMANLMLQEIRSKGLKFIEDEIIGIKKTLTGVEVKLTNGNFSADKLIIAAGPFINYFAKMIGLQFPIWNTLQRKIILPDPKNILPKEMPFTIFADEQYLNWSDEETAFLKTNKDLEWMLQKFPGGLHIKPAGEGKIKMGWAFSSTAVEPKWSIDKMAHFPQVLLKGGSTFIPALEKYAENIPTPIIEYGGYYNRTKENWPFISPTQIKNVFVVGALAGFGTMVACAAGELCALYLTEKELPKYAPYFHTKRNENPTIKKEIAMLNNDGQL